VRLQARDREPRRLAKATVLPLERQHPEPEQPVRGHRSPDCRRYRAEILAGNGAASPLALDRQNGIELFRTVPNVDAVAATGTGRNPVEPVESHDVVDPEQAGCTEMVSEYRANVPVSVLADPFRVERGETPDLPAGEERIGRRTGTHACHEEFRPRPDIESLWVHAQREIEVQCRALARTELVGRQPLSDQVHPRAFLETRDRQRAIVPKIVGPSTRWAVPIDCCTEPRIQLDVRAILDPPLDLAPAFRISLEPFGQRGQRRAALAPR